MSTFSKIALGLLAGVFALSAVPAASAQNCSSLSLRGSYGYTVTGTIVASTGPLQAGPFVAVGKIDFDGVHNVTTTRSLSDNGFIFQHDSGSGTYTVNSDCTGSFNITVGPPGNLITLTLDLVLDDLNEIRAVVTNKGIVLALQGRKQQPVYF